MKKLTFLLFSLLPLTLAAQGIGTSAPDFTLASLDHGQITLSGYHGKVVYLFFFGYN